MTLRKRALSEENIAKVFSKQSEHGYTASIHTSPPGMRIVEVTHRLRGDRFAKKLQRTVSIKNITPESIIEAVGNSSPIYNDAIRDIPMALLIAAQAPITLKRFKLSAHITYVLINWKLLEIIPHIPGIRAAKVFLSAIGFKLIDHWSKKYKRFTPYYNAFVNEKVRNKAKQFAVIKAMGEIPKEIREIAEINSDIDKRILKRNKVYDKQRIIQDSIRDRSTPNYFTTCRMGNQPITSTDTTLGITTGSSAAYQNAINPAANTQASLYGVADTSSLFGSLGKLFGGK
jgi:hypothetical protein